MAQTDAPKPLRLKNPDDCTVESVIAFEEIADKMQTKQRIRLAELVKALAPMTENYAEDELRQLSLGDLKAALYAFRDAMTGANDPNDERPSDAA
jgi:hypothetical protein